VSRWALVATALALAACGRTTLPLVSPADVARATERWPDTSDVELNAGRDVLRRSCGGCHLVPLPTDVAPAGWPGVLDEMAPEAALESDERQALERYLVTLSASAGG
jgi:cytochrome c5